MKDDDIIDNNKTQDSNSKKTSEEFGEDEQGKLYETQSPQTILAAMSGKILTYHMRQKTAVIVTLIIFLIVNILTFHCFVSTILKPEFITAVNTEILKYILIAYVTATVGISSALIGLVSSWPKINRNK